MLIYVLAALLLLSGCSGPVPRTPTAKAPPPAPIALEPPRVGAEALHQLLFTASESYPGLELEYELLDASGGTLKLERTQLGAIFGKAPLAAGKEVILRVVRPRELIKVTRPRPRSPLDPPPLSLDRIRNTRLRRAVRCHQQEWVWQPGMMLPPEIEVDTMPEPGTVFLRNSCPRSRPLRDARLRRTFRYRRILDPDRAWVDLKAQYNARYPRGATLLVDLLDGRGQSVLRSGCRLQLRQPPVFVGQLAEYRIQFSGATAVARLRRVKAARITEVVPDAADAREVRVEQVCD